MSRKAEFLETGARLAAKVGVNNVTRRAIAAEHNVSDPLVGKHVGGKDDLRKGIKSTMKKLGLKEPDDALAKGKALRARTTKLIPASKRVAKKATAAKKSPAKKSAPVSRAPAKSAGKPAVAKKATPAKKSVAAKPSTSAGSRGTKPATPLPADPKKGAPSKKVLKQAPANKFKTKVAPPPLPALPELP